jgi:hypothetical protein
MLVALQLVGLAVFPLNLTVLEPGVGPKFAPVMITIWSTTPEVGDRPLIAGPVVTVKLTPLLGTALTVTTALPVVAPLGTRATMLVALQLVGVAAVPLNVTVLVPCVAPKPVPAIVTAKPTGPESGDRLVMVGLCAAADGINRIATKRSRSSFASRLAPRATNCAFRPAKMLEPLMACRVPTTGIVECTVFFLRPQV